MPKNVRGITVEIGGDTTKLGKALKDTEQQTKSVQKELKLVNTALKFNPAAGQTQSGRGVRGRVVRGWRDRRGADDQLPP